MCGPNMMNLLYGIGKTDLIKKTWRFN